MCSNPDSGEIPPPSARLHRKDKILGWVLNALNEIADRGKKGMSLLFTQSKVRL